MVVVVRCLSRSAMAMIVKAASYSLFGAAITKVRITSTTPMMTTRDGTMPMRLMRDVGR